MSTERPSGTITRLHLRDGIVDVSEPGAGRWAARFTPHRADHPDAPGVTLDSESEGVPQLPGRDEVVEWARGYFSGRDPRSLAEVSLDEDASEAEIRAVERAFDAAGTPAIVSANFARRSAGPLPWAMVVTFSLTAFVAGFLGAAGADAWRALRDFVCEIFETRRRDDRSDGSIWWDDEHRTIILTDRISNEGFRQLMSGELPDSGYFVWDEAKGEWVRS